MASKDIAFFLVDQLATESQAAEGISHLSVRACLEQTYTSVEVGGFVVWDDQDQNDAPDTGETAITALAYARQSIRELRDSFAALLPETEDPIP
jgi:hypothetical protein